MRKLILILLLPLFGHSQTLIDSYSESNYDQSTNIYAGATVTYMAQSCTTGVSMKLHSCKFYARKLGSPTGSIYAAVYAHSGTYGTSSVPTGSALATSDAVDVSGYSTSFALRTFTFSGANLITLTANTKYCVVIYYNAGDASNYVNVGRDASSPAHGGNYARSGNGSTWAAVNTSDICFYLYGTPLSGVTPYQYIGY